MSYCLLRQGNLTNKQILYRRKDYPYLQKKNIASSTVGTSLKTSSFDVNNPFGGQTQEQFIGEERTSQVIQQQRKEEQQRKTNTQNLLKNSKNVDKSLLPLSGKSRDEIYRMNPEEIVSAERIKSEQAKQRYAEQADIPLSEVVKNSANNALIQIKKNLPQLNLLGADVGEAVLGGELVRKLYEWEGRDFDEVRANAYKELENLNSQLKQTGGSVSDNIRYLNGTGLVGNLVDGIFNVGSTAVPALASGGSLTLTGMTGQAVADYNTAKANSKGISVEELYNRGEAELGVPLMLGSLATGLEFVGLKGTQRALLGQLKGSAAKKAAIFGFETNKEGLTELVQNGIDAANMSLAEGKSVEQASKDAVKSMFSKEGLDSYLMGTFGSLGAAGVGRVVSQIIKPKAQQEVTTKLTELDALEKDIANPNLSENAKSILAIQAQQKISEISEVVDKDINETDLYSNQQKSELNALNDEKVALSEIFNNPEVSDTTRQNAEARISEIDNTIDSIKPEEQVVFEYDSIDQVPDSLQNNIEEVDGKITLTLPKSEADALQQRIKDGLEPDMTLKEGRVETLTTPAEQTTTETIEAVIEPNLAINEEISVQENIEVPVVEETASNEVLAKAETDLEALKQVTDKTKKYTASVKRLNDAFREGRISEQEFNDTKARFDDVIAESLPNVPKITTLSEQEVADFNGELEGDEITVNDIIDYEKSNATEQLINEAENVPKTVQERADDGKGNVGESKASEGVSVEEGKASEKAVTEPKQSDKATEQAEVSDFNALLNQKLPSRETRETRSNVERETGERLSQEMKEFEGVDFAASLDYGDRVVQQSKSEYGNDYVSKLTDEVKGSGMTIDKKAVILVSLENDLRRQLAENPKSTKLRKQVDMATKETIELLRTAGRGTAVGVFRQAARANYNIEEAARAIFSEKEIADRKKVEDAVFATSEDIQAEYEAQQKQGTSLDASVEAAIEEGVEKRINEIYESLPSRRRQQADKAIKALDNIQKRLRTKTYDASIGVPVAIIDAGISTIKAAIKAGVAIADAVELGISKIKEHYGKNWDKENEFRDDMLKGFEQEGIDSREQRRQQDAFKQALIDAGYGKEINVRTKNGVEKRNILDWKKLTGTEGSFETLSDNLSKLKEKGYSEAEIAELQQQLEEEYNELHASIIEKSINELNRRNAPKEGKQKILARRLAELYNLGLYDTQNINEYQNIINNSLGFSTQSQEAFNEIRKLNESLARLLDSRDDNGNKLSDVALASLETQVKNHIQKVIQKAQFAEGNGFFKASVILKNVFSAMQRMMLASIGQLIENPFSGKLNDLHVQLQDAFSKKKWDNAELREHRKQLAKVMYKDAAIYQGDEYGGVGNPFTSKNAIEDFVNGLSKNALYQVFVGALSGRQYLDAADSYFKIKRTEKEFTHNIIRILTDKSNPNGAMTQEDSLQYVSEIITGQSFEQSKDVARRIITDINEQAGKELIRTSETNVIRVANDLVKDALVNGQKLDAKQVESAFKAGYTTAGKSIGHESNNIITDFLTQFNQANEQRLKDALKKKDWSTAALLNMTNILIKNIAFPFVGGGTNWTVIGLQKMGVPTEWFRSDVGFSKKPIDLSTREGLKELEKNLAANATRQRMYSRNVIGAFTALSAILAFKAGVDEDEYEKWLKKHPNTAKLINKLQPVPLTIYMASDEGSGEMLTALLEVIGRRKNYDEFKIKRAAENFYEGYRKGSKKKTDKAWGEVGELVGRRFNVPYLQSIVNYDKVGGKIKREFEGNYKKEKPTKSNGFVEGFFTNGLYEFMTKEDKPKK